jgi:class 3 adenylate cyclase
VEAERRQVTILFTDMVGFTTFSERSGEEAAFRLMQDVAKLTGEAVRAEGGVVQGFTGDGVMAVFGAPVAYEDAPLRACRAALSILDRLDKASCDFEMKFAVRPELRIGVNTGVAVVGEVQDGAGGGVTVMGDAVNVAARLQSLAEPGTIYLAEATHKLAQGQIEAVTWGEHQLKGKAEPLEVYKLTGLRRDVSRFAAVIERGLSPYVGRERELEVLEHNLVASRQELRVVDIVAEPGMGKSRLLHEFRQRVGRDQALILSGSCSSDGQQTPFLPFIEVVRSSFQVSAGDPEKDVERKLEIGLTVLGLSSLQNLGLLLNLLGLNPPEGALTGLDGLLIGLRTRDLVQSLLEVRCRLSPVVLLLEDLHWIDSVSEEVLGRMIGSEAKLPLLLLHTRRPEYHPEWLDRSIVTTLHVEPLAAGDIRHLVQARLGVESLPEAFGLLITEKAEGNALFAEEIVSFLAERGVLRTNAGKAEFDAGVVAALPASVQSLLTARVDRLAPQDRALLQAAAVIGRRFDSQLLGAVLDRLNDVDTRLAATYALDLVHPDGKLGDYFFKHALVRDALYQSLLKEPRAALHLKIAEEIERRNDNRLPEVVEILAHHYGQTDRADKAFTYLIMAGAKSLGVYSLDEADEYFRAAVAVVESNPECVSDHQVAEFTDSYAMMLNVSARWYDIVAVVRRYMPRIDRIGDDPRVVSIRHHYVFALIYNTSYQDAAVTQQETLRMAERLGDFKSVAYALAGELHLTTLVAPKSLSEFEILKKNAIAAAKLSDAYVKDWIGYMIFFEELFRGRLNCASDAARQLMEVGRRANNPRSIGLGLAGLAAVALVSASYTEALEYSEQSMAVAVAPHDKMTAMLIKGYTLVSLGRVEEASNLLETYRNYTKRVGALLGFTMTNSVVGAIKLLRGNVAEGLHSIADSIANQDEAGSRSLADWDRITLAEVYLQMIVGNERPPFLVLLKNLPIILIIMARGVTRIRALVARVAQNPRFDPDGLHIGRCQMILGLLYKAKKKRPQALEHLYEARRIASQFGPSPILSRIEAALAEIA